MAIAQHASTFLVSTLPNALLTTDPECALRDAGRTAPAGIGGVLPAVRQLLDTSAETGQRCHAVEELDEMGATLDPLLLCQLLADDDPTVARYALGLVPSSAASERLIEQAASSPHTGDRAFREELELLQDLVTSKDRHRVVSVNQPRDQPLPDVGSENRRQIDAAANLWFAFRFILRACPRIKLKVPVLCE